MSLEDLNKIVNEQEPNISQIVVLKKGQIVYNNTWHDYNVDDTFHVMSVTKSIVSILV